MCSSDLFPSHDKGVTMLAIEKGDIVRSKECREWIKVFVKEGLM